jgi:hypothetical protein
MAILKLRLEITFVVKQVITKIEVKKTFKVRFITK